MSDQPTDDPAARNLERVRRACLALPLATERLSHGAPSFFAAPRCFAMFQDEHHGDGRLALWCAAPEGAQAELLALEPDRFFRPPYVGHRGWVGVLVDTLTDFELVAVLEEAYTCSASAAGLKALGSATGVSPGEPGS